MAHKYPKVTKDSRPIYADVYRNGPDRVTDAEIAAYAGQRYEDDPRADTPADRGWSKFIQHMRPHRAELHSHTGCALADLKGEA